jgi:dTDP-4-amino-4,6-dideoxygalactose transaminase
MVKTRSKFRPNVEKFEKAWSEYNEMEYGVACNSGTNALFLALKSLGIGKGDEVIVPEFTMVATAWAVSYTGAKPVFVDCGDDLNIDVSKVKLNKNTKAIIPVHIYGRQCDMVSILDKCDGKIHIIEDMAEAHGIRPCGDIACFSFYQNKIISTDEGGMCLTNDEYLAEEMRSLANMYFDKERTLIHPKIGYNFRMTDIQAEYGFKQVKTFKKIIKERRQIEKWWFDNLDEETRILPRKTVWMYDFDCGDRQEEIKKEIPMTRYFFKPMSMQPMYYDEKYKELNAYKWSKRGLYLPLWDMTEKEVISISKRINKCLKYSEKE